MNTSFNEDGAQFAWDNTSIAAVQTCMRHYYYSIVLGYQERNKSVHLDFGGWFASGLENFHKDIAKGTEYEQALINMTHAALLATWNHSTNAQGEKVAGTGFAWVAKDKFGRNETAKTRENLVRSLIWYVENFREEDLQTYITPEGEAAVEYTFKIPVENDILFCGHLDRVATKEGSNFITDNKTTGQALTSWYFEEFNLSGQFSMYTFAGQAIFSIPVKGVVIDAAQIMVGFTRFARSFTFRTEGQLNEWYDNSMYTIETARHLSREQYYPMNLSSCGKYGGCPFGAVCGRDPKLREGILKTDFVKRLWDPLVER